MERTLSAYSVSHIQRYFDDVKKNGLTEHGFPRLTANIGILIAHGRRQELRALFLDMMEFCCRTIPTVKAANDFSVREILCCLCEVEESGVADGDALARWKGYLRGIDPATCYNVAAKSPEDKVKNWALFTGLSEFFRIRMGLGGSEAFVDTQLATQLQWLDENGMYMDGSGEKHHPMTYDLVPRGLFALLLNEGYCGRYCAEIDACLKKAALCTLKMQSPNGEISFGGRSNQFVHCEAWMAAVYEYEAHRYAKEGNFAMVRAFRAAIARAVGAIEEWLSMNPIRHVKNRFPTESRFGCEDYAYFDKYMITVASNLYAAYRLSDPALPTENAADCAPTVFATTEHFHKLFLKAGGYGLEFDLDADPHYDASGLGRIHKAGAPAAICLSVPCPREPLYTVGIDEPRALSICPCVLGDGEWLFGTDAAWEVTDTFCDAATARAVLRTRFENGAEVLSRYTVCESGVVIELEGAQDVACLLPAFDFDGDVHTKIQSDGNGLTVVYRGARCHYTVSGEIREVEGVFANRNGYYKVYMAVAKEHLKVTVEIFE